MKAIRSVSQERQQRHLPGNLPESNFFSGSTNRLMAMARRYTFLLYIIVLLAIPFKILTYNYLPIDDAKRHVAKAVSGRAWSTVLVMNERFADFDHNAGWHRLLGLLHAGGLDKEGLLMASVILTFSAFALTGLFLFRRRPEAWLLAFFLFALIAQPTRLMLGRPYILSMAAYLFLLRQWDKPGARIRHWLIILVIAAAAYVHGAWHLYLFLPLTLLFAGRLRDAVTAGLGCLAGAVIAGALTLDPYGFLVRQVQITLESTLSATLTRQLVSEYQPHISVLPLFAFALALLARVLLDRDQRNSARSLAGGAAAWGVVLGYVLGLQNGRFWHDWGVVALLYFVADTLSRHLPMAKEKLNIKVVSAPIALAAAIFLVFTVDSGSRWTNHDFVDSLTLEDETHREWLPGDGGIFYASSMLLFYDTFFTNPDAPWRYILGFESTFMPEEDLMIFREIQFYNYSGNHLYDPWIAKMRAIDRLVIYRGKSARPSIEALEWKYVAYNTWIGRLPEQPSRPDREDGNGDPLAPLGSGHDQAPY